YLLGNNPWGVSMVNGVGSAWAHFPHHQIADIKHVELTGFWGEGPVQQSEFANEGITLRRPDIYSLFQAPGAVYHDDAADYTTNEPTINANAIGLAMIGWYANAV